jgi:ABC-type cobalt transport system substrate-binding protein
MRKVVLAGMLIFFLLLGLWLGLTQLKSKWPGVDEAVVERFARESYRPPRDPYINPDRGDLLLFFFLLAGVAGGFVGGYFYRELFPPKSTKGARNA